mgnify:CR=1 FL=1
MLPGFGPALGATLLWTGLLVALPLAALAHRREAVEGHRATDTLTRLAKQRGVQAPILFCLYEILYQGLDPAAGVTALMTRDLKPEA